MGIDHSPSNNSTKTPTPQPIVEDQSESQKLPTDFDHDSAIKRVLNNQMIVNALISILLNQLGKFDAQAQRVVPTNTPVIQEEQSSEGKDTESE